nr:hypothetical protein [uncultured Methanolobus sp.]
MKTEEELKEDIDYWQHTRDYIFNLFCKNIITEEQLKIIDNEIVMQLLVLKYVIEDEDGIKLIKDMIKKEKRENHDAKNEEMTEKLVNVLNHLQSELETIKNC